MTRKSLQIARRSTQFGPVLWCLFASLLASPSCARETAANTACLVALDAVQAALSPTGSDSRAVNSAAWQACKGTDVDPRQTARAAMLLLSAPSGERANTLTTLQGVYQRLVAAGEDGRELIEINDAIGTCQFQLGQREAALATARRGLELRRAEFGANSVEAVEGVLNVASGLQNEPERALALVGGTYLRLEDELGEADPATLRALAGLAFLNRQLGRFDEAARLDERHYEIRRTLPQEAKEPPDGR